jgi:transposase
MDEASFARLRICHKVVTLIGKEVALSPKSKPAGDCVNYLGIDIGKNNHVACLLDENGKSIVKSFAFSNTKEGGESLLGMLARQGVKAQSLEVGLEATGHYWLSVYSFLYDQGYKLHVINPIQTDGWRKGMEIRKRKTDIIDAQLIAELVRYGDFMEARLPDEALLSLKQLTRFRSYLVDSISDLKRKVICVLDQVFPEYQRLFSDVFGITSKEILLEFTDPESVESVSAEKLAEFIADCSKNRLGAEKALQLRQAAENSFGVTFCRDSFSFQLRMLVEQVKYIEQQVLQTEAEIKRIMNKIASPIQSIPGIGAVTGAVILGEIADIRRFERPSQLVAFAGLDATVRQSGEFEGTQNRISKRGSPHLRRALFQASLVAACGVNPDPELRAFYEKKRAEGKHHLAVIGAVSRKLCNIIFAVLSENRPFEKRNP